MELVPEGISVVPRMPVERTFPARSQERSVGYEAKRPTIKEMFCPPNPKLLESARSHFPSRAVLGT
jgi:hypothetical protein